MKFVGVHVILLGLPKVLLLSNLGDAIATSGTTVIEKVGNLRANRLLVEKEANNATTEEGNSKGTASPGSNSTAEIETHPSETLTAAIMGRFASMTPGTPSPDGSPTTVNPLSTPSPVSPTTMSPVTLYPTIALDPTFTPSAITSTTATNSSPGVSILPNTTIVDNCMRFDFTSCQECTAHISASNTATCIWCPGNAMCLDPVNTRSASACPDSNFLQQTCPPPLPVITNSTKSNATGGNVWDDPLYDANKWAYDMMNLPKVWEQGYTGDGVMIQIVDNGVEANHTEFSSKFDIEASCDQYMPPQQQESYRNNIRNRNHGTAVASIVAGNANNDVCAAGIAPDASLSSCWIDLSGAVPISGAAAYKKGLATTDISVNSWAYDDACGWSPEINNGTTGGEDAEPGNLCPLENNSTGSFPPLNSYECEKLVYDECKQIDDIKQKPKFCEKYLHLYADCKYLEIDEGDFDAIEGGIKEGRDKKGIIYVFSAGNFYERGATANMEQLLNSRYTISVGAVGKDEHHGSYSMTGSAALFISGPGGDDKSTSNYVTASHGGGCQDSGAGTSFAAPSVAGVIALILQANPDLGWRDVQGILAKTARKIDSTSAYWTTNAAGLHHNKFYGFGMVDAFGAVEAAKNWESWGRERTISAKSGMIDLPIIPGGESPTKSSLSLEAEDNSTVLEAVVVTLDVDHSATDHLEILLKSPQGTVSKLIAAVRPPQQTKVDEKWTMKSLHSWIPFRKAERTKKEKWTLMSLSSWGENPSGEWTLSLIDTVPAGDTIERTRSLASNGTQANTLVRWGIVAYGHDVKQPTVEEWPTESPTEPPSPVPSEIPTIDPTRHPSMSPTQLNLTESPTVVPSPVPSYLPSMDPTRLPTYSPTVPNVTEQPTESPTVVPSPVPSYLPSMDPTRLPTDSPTTEQPTESPTDVPSPIPTELPTGEPTWLPSDSPTWYPTFPPTLPPTSLAPTLLPTTTTESPTNHPPSGAPAQGSTESPSESPTTTTTEPTFFYPTTFRPTPPPSTAQPTLPPTPDPALPPSYTLPPSTVAPTTMIPTLPPTTFPPTLPPTTNLPTLPPTTLPPTLPPTTQIPTPIPTTEAPTTKPPTDPPSKPPVPPPTPPPVEPQPCPSKPTCTSGGGGGTTNNCGVVVNPCPVYPCPYNPCT